MLTDCDCKERENHLRLFDVVSSHLSHGSLDLLSLDLCASDLPRGVLFFFFDPLDFLHIYLYVNVVLESTTVDSTQREDKLTIERSIGFQCHTKHAQPLHFPLRPSLRCICDAKPSITHITHHTSPPTSRPPQYR
jgi:hypothetical protein